MIIYYDFLERARTEDRTRGSSEAGLERLRDLAVIDHGRVMREMLAKGGYNDEAENPMEATMVF